MIEEISQNGMSAMISTVLKVGDRVELEPVLGAVATAVVRRCAGRLCGFEFLSLNAEQTRKIREMCVLLPAYYSATLDPWRVPAR